MPESMPKTYDYSKTEQKLYEWWESNGWFKPEARPTDADPFVISMPPPNVTGKLHSGHALFVSLEDLMTRKARMDGKAALWVPGTDHASIATQLQVERHLLQTLEMTREEIGREKFLEYAWEWKEKYGGEITNQMRRLGASCDWDRERFTLDEGLTTAVREAFVRLYRMGLIYQADYLVNWSPGLKTAVSDLEVEYSEEAGLLYTFKYPLALPLGDLTHIPVSTTRPETILGDTAVAVHPDDPRFSDLVGMEVVVPILGRKIPVIADSYVDINFGTGALKVTPGHDPNDFDIGNRHGLAIINVMTEQATMSDAAGPYSGLDRYECREQLWDDMKRADLTIRTEEYTLNVPRSQRGGEIIEPMVSRQWFVNVKPQAEMALDAVRNGRIKIVPERFNKIWENWLGNIRPWCVSRQLWWGHRLPVWYCDSCGHVNVAVQIPSQCESCGSHSMTQDNDVLDTWFSSALWPFSTLGWPEDTPDLQRFYPTDVLETGYDIIFFWVARMVMAGLLFTNDIPFHTIYLHGLVRAGAGKKMSKSSGNVENPLDVIAEFGTDALRFSLLTGSSPGNDMTLSPEKLDSNKKFANKLWNIARYIQHVSSESREALDPNQSTELSLADHWIARELDKLVASVNRLFDSYQFGEAGRQIHDFVWNDFADWYLELSKVQLDMGQHQQSTLDLLAHTLSTILRLLHPYMPFVTEEIWQQTKAASNESTGSKLFFESEALIIAPWPRDFSAEAAIQPNAKSADLFAEIRELVRSIRAVRAEKRVAPSRRIAATIQSTDNAPQIDQFRQQFAFLARTSVDQDSLKISADHNSDPSEIVVASGDLTAYLPLGELVDVDAETRRLASEEERLSGEISRLQKLLASPFAERAPAAVVEREQERLAQYLTAVAAIRQQLSSLGSS